MDKALENQHKKDNQDEKLKTMRNVMIAGMAAEPIQRYGEAVKQHVTAYSGVDNEAGKQLVKGLKQISNEKVNPDYRYQNIHQQAGFAAEVKEIAKGNAERIINHNPNRLSRTDDLGRVNDPLHDIVELDRNGNMIPGSGKQMKFVGASENDPAGMGDAARNINKMLSKKYDKYFDADTDIQVPSDLYDDILKKADKKKDALSKQLEYQKKSGNSEQAQKIQEQIDKVDKLKSKLDKSNVSRSDAMLAREHPMLSTAKDIAGVSHRAGIETAKNAAIFAGSISIAKNLVGVCKGNTEPDEAIINVIKDTTGAAVVGYGTSFVGSTLKGIMQNCKSAYTRAISKTNIPGVVVIATLEASKTLKRYFKGEIDGVECMETLGEQGTTMIASAMFAAIGQAAIPIPIVGGMIGSMLGYAISSAAYGELLSALKAGKLADEERVRIEQACNEHIKLLREYRAELENMVEQYLSDTTELFRESFDGIKNALAIGDVDWLIDSANKVTKGLGKEVQYNNMDEFDTMMSAGITFKL